MKLLHKYKFIFFVFLGAILLMVDSFINKFPIVYSDTATFLDSGFNFETPFDRPITYGLFVRFFSLNGISLWFVVFSQSFIVSYLIFLLSNLIFDSKNYLKYGLITIFILSFLTGISWSASQITPDIFTSIALLAMILILLGTFPGKTQIILYFIFFFSVSMHMSHVLLFLIILIFIFLVKKYLIPKEIQAKRLSKIFLLLILTFASIVTMGSAISKSKHVFFMGALVEHGILKKYLDEHCATKNYKICYYKDSLPKKAYQFIWDEKSPFYKIGDWKGTKNDFTEIIKGTLTEPKFIALHIQESLKASIQQLTMCKIGDGYGSFLKGTILYKRLTKHLPLDKKLYSKSRQSLSQMTYINGLNYVYTFVIYLSLISLFFVFIKNWISIGLNLKKISLLIIFGVLINAWDCGTFANAIDRLGCKMIWLIPLLATLSIIKLLDLKINKI